MKYIRILILALIVITTSTNSVYSQSKTIHTKDSTETIIIKVKGVDCSEDLKIMSSNIKKQKGISSCKVIKEGVTSSFEVKYNPALITKKEIYAVIENTSGCDNSNEKPYTVKNK